MKNDLSPPVMLAAAIWALAVLAFSLLWGGFFSGLTLSVLWGWFVAPLFALPALSIAQAYGLALVVRAARGAWNYEKSKEGPSSVIAKAFFVPPLVCGLMLLIGWIAKGLV